MHRTDETPSTGVPRLAPFLPWAGDADSASTPAEPGALPTPGGEGA